MHCPFCKHPDSRVVGNDGMAIGRRRQCPGWCRRVTTIGACPLPQRAAHPGRIVVR
ncbi:NrdR family transcriptional regulator, partial [Streptomyces asoensis]|uniref:NrdR family transcriptional regulator n=1 Tax=Streptomyces asoensis TaxID=249586 RepID=UPI003F4CD7CD